MRTPAYGWGAISAKAPLEPIKFVRRVPNADDVCIKIKYCGVCHSDVHSIRNELGGDSEYPLIPGHEIVGHVTAVGSNVTKFKVGDTVGVGCMVDSCLKCDECKANREQCCECMVPTFNGRLKNTSHITLGGYSDHIVVREEFVLRIPPNLDLAAAAPLLCVGVSAYSALNQCNVKKGSKVGVVGIGGLGHIAVKIAHAMEAEVTVFTIIKKQINDAKRLGADHVIMLKHEDEMKAAANSLEYIVDAAGSPHDLNPYLNILKPGGILILLGLPHRPHLPFNTINFVFKKLSIIGSLIGGIKETQEMLDFCGKHNITADIELIKINYINEAYERMLKSDVRYRFVIDNSTIDKGNCKAAYHISKL